MNGKNRHGTGKAKMFLGLLALIGLGAVLLPLLLPAPGQVCLLLTDPELHSEVGGLPINIHLDGGSTTFRSQKAPGGLEVYLDRVSEGQRGIQVSAQGYAPTSIDVNVMPLKVARAVLPLKPIFGLLNYRVVNASNGKELTASVTITNASGAPLKGGTNSPQYLEPGEYVIKAEAPGFCPSSSRATLESGKSTPVNVALSSGIGENELARIVLVWKQNPRDIDAMLVQSVDRKKLVTFWKNKQTVLGGTPVSTLDFDHMQGLGPETLTIFKGHGGTYSYVVRYYEGNGTLGSSGAVVRVITKGCTERVFEVPRDITSRVWHVVDINEDSQGQPVIKPVNTGKSDSDFGFKVQR